MNVNTLNEMTAAPVVIPDEMKPSRILRRTTMPQIHGPLFLTDKPFQWCIDPHYLPDTKITCACAMGALGCEVLGVAGMLALDAMPHRELTEATGVDYEQSVRFPVGDGYEGNMPLWVAIAHLNDDEQWSFERIADWLEGIGL